jgi:ribosome biogenesis GTPase A
LFLIKHLQEIKSPEFLARYKLDSFTLEVNDVLNHIASTRGCLKQKGLPDYDRVYKLILLDFRNGELGKCCFGIPPLK